MSAQFGRWNFDGLRIDPAYLRDVADVLRPYGPDRESVFDRADIALQYHAFHTTAEAVNEQQPYVTRSGNVILWDGRLDNRSELLRGLSASIYDLPTDVAIVAALYEESGTRCFSELIGDWALSIWSPYQPALILAKDFAGVRPLYYSMSPGSITWSTVLDPLVAFSKSPLDLDEEYIAGWLSMFPATHLTPYISIRSVPPGSLVAVNPRRCRVIRYWEFRDKKIRYNQDSQYEEHFRVLFSESVRRRLRSHQPVLAELSGGMDSSSIVCVADAVLGERSAGCPRLDTISYYNDLEPHWNERPYFTKVEERRGRVGCHAEVGMSGSFWPEYRGPGVSWTPGTGFKPTQSQLQFRECLRANRDRVLLSGIGGDEVLGGVPSAVPELADLLVCLRLLQFTRQLVAWALVKRRPAFHLLADTVRAFLPRALAGSSYFCQPPAWVHRSFTRRNRHALQGYLDRLRVLGSSPTFQENLHALEALRRQLASLELPAEPCFERRYPYLDRDLLQFLYSIPREQLVRPGERRSLMRRALRGIVPEEILTRKRKAYLARSPLLDISDAWNLTDLVVGELGIVDVKKLSAALDMARRGSEVSIVTLQRTFLIEQWMVKLRRHAAAGPEADPRDFRFLHANWRRA